MEILKDRKKDILSDEFKVAAEIFRFNNILKEPIWFTKLAEELKDEMSSSTVLRALNVLSDWGIVKAQYGATGKGRAGRLLYIAGEARNTIESVYEQFWKPVKESKKR